MHLVSLGGAMCKLVYKCRKYSPHNFNSLKAAVTIQVQSILERVDTQLKEELGHDDDVVKFSRDCLRIQAYGFKHEEDEAKRLLGRILEENQDWIARDVRLAKNWDRRKELRLSKYFRVEYLADAIGSLLQVSLNRCRGADADFKGKVATKTMDWLAEHSVCFEFDQLDTFENLPFRFKYLALNIPDHIAFLEQVGQREGAEVQVIMTSAFCRSFIRAEGSLSAYSLYCWAHRKGVVLPETIIRNMLRSLNRQGEYAIEAKVTEDLLEKTINEPDDMSGGVKLQKSTLRGIAMSSAKRKEEKTMERALDLLRSQHNQSEKTEQDFEFETRLYYSCRKGEVEKVAELVEGRYDMRIAPNEVPQEGLLYPTYHVHARLVEAYITANQIDQAEATLHRMVHFGYQPDTFLMNEVLNYYANSDDLTSTIALFQQMLDADIETSRRTFTILIAFFAKRKDVENASAVLEAMKAGGMEPDRFNYNSLLNAHVESSDWERAMGLFTWMFEHKEPRLRPSSATYNIMLKAHVLRALPVQDIFAFFKQMLSAGLLPDETTYTLVLQSVTDAGFMDLAEHVFGSIDERLGGQKGKAAGKGANLWHFTVMIQGYLRIRRLDIARDYVNESRKRGYTADGILWAILIKAYAAREDGDKLSISREMIQGVEFDQSKEYALIYQPILQAYGKRADVDQVESLIQEMKEKEVEVPFFLWTSLLDALRRDENVDGALEVWNLIFDKAQESVIASDKLASSTPGVRLVNSTLPFLPSSSSPPPSSSSTSALPTRLRESRRNLLCLPLSILISALSRQGEYERVAQEWLRCRKAGFAFDSHNWNHLCVSFLHAGRIRDSFNIIQRILNASPPSRAWAEDEEQVDREGEYTSFRDMRERLAKSITTKAENNDRFDTTSTPARPPNRRHQGRVRDDYSVRYPSQEEQRDGGEGEDDSDGRYAGQNYEHSERSRGQRSLQRGHGAALSLLKNLHAQSVLEGKQTPWYTHHETLLLLRDTVEKFRASGEKIEVGSRAEGENKEAVGIVELLQRYPRVEQLLDQFEGKIEGIQESARVEAVKDNLRARRRVEEE
ncbi:hypothetical protein CBS101457_004133 [Exobasidium rhododendri]|nr:hypothetical protein CBS101457_004133 [Exobasidium rhododendri]